MGVQGTRGGRTSWPRAKGLGAGRSAGGAGRTVTGTALQAGSPFAPHSRGLEELPGEGRASPPGSDRRSGRTAARGARYSVSIEVPRSILKYKTVLGTLDATPKVP